MQTENIPPGYASVSLIEALNGPPQVNIRQPVTIDAVDGPETDAVQVNIYF